MAFQKRIRFLYYLADVPLRSGKQNNVARERPDPLGTI